MKTIFAVLFFTVLFISRTTGAEHQQKSLAFVGVTVIDSTGAPATPDMTVLIEGNRITAIGRSETVSVPLGAVVVDATGKFLIPGLWDMHVHLFNHVHPGPPGASYFPLLIANGITGVRDMWTKFDDMAQVQKWRQEFAMGATIPRIVAAGILVDGVHPVWPEADTVATAEAARHMVDQVKAHEIDFVKVYWNLSRQAYFAIAAECRKQGISFAGHVPFSVSAGEASDSGQESIEHLTEVAFSCSVKEKALRKVPPKKWKTKYENEILSSYDEAKGQQLFSRFTKNKTWQVPTLVFYQRLALSETDLLSDDRLKYIPPTQREQWKSFLTMMKERTPEQVVYGDHLRRSSLQLVAAMRHAGVQFMAGTDMGIAVSYVYPGFSLHDELALLVHAGFTPMEALQTATRNPAEFVGKADSMGTIEKGKIADIIVLDANPLEDITNTTKIDAVVLDGNLIPKQLLQRMLDQVETSAR